MEPGVLSGTESGVQLPSRRSSDDENNHFVVNASFQRRSTDNAEDTTLQSPRDRSASGTTRGEERTETQAESAFFRSTYKISQPDPGRVAPRSSEQIMQDPRFLGHQVLFKDRVFSDSDWKAHVSYRRYLPEPVVMLRVLAAQAYPLACVLLITAGCATYEHVIRRSDWPSLDNLEAAFAYNLCSFALSLLLIFKTNSSYSRFWEARCAWGLVYTCCRVFIAKTQAYAPAMPVHTRKLILRWTIALPYVMRTHLVDYKPGSDSLEELLTRPEVEWLRSTPNGCAPHHPIKAVNVLLAAISDVGMSDFFVADVAAMLERYLAQCGICERISRTPIPMPYTRHTTRFILLYIAFMPLLLWGDLQWWTFLVASLITMLLAGIDNIGIMIENPMRILPMAAYCTTIHQNVLLSAEAWVSSTRQTAVSLVRQQLRREPPAWQRGEEQFVPCCSGDVDDPSETVPHAYKYSLSSRWPSPAKLA